MIFLTVVGCVSFLVAYLYALVRVCLKLAGPDRTGDPGVFFMLVVVGISVPIGLLAQFTSK